MYAQATTNHVLELPQTYWFYGIVLLESYHSFNYSFPHSIQPLPIFNRMFFLVFRIRRMVSSKIQNHKLFHDILPILLVNVIFLLNEMRQREIS